MVLSCLSSSETCMQNIGRGAGELAWTLLDHEASSVSNGVRFSEMEPDAALRVMELVQCEPNLRCTLSLILKRTLRRVKSPTEPHRIGRMDDGLGSQTLLPPRVRDFRFRRRKGLQAVLESSTTRARRLSRTPRAAATSAYSPQRLGEARAFTLRTALAYAGAVNDLIRSTIRGCIDALLSFFREN